MTGKPFLYNTVNRPVPKIYPMFTYTITKYIYNMKYNMNYLHNDFNNEMTSSFKQQFPNEWNNTFNPINNDAPIHVNIHNERDILKL